MRRVVFGIAGVAAIALGLWQFGRGLQEFSGTAGSHAPLEAASKAAQKAATDFQALADASNASGLPPRQSDPAVKPLLDTVFDTSALHREALDFADLGPVNDWLSVVPKIMTVYTLAGTGLADIQQAANAPGIEERIDHNLVQFAPEYGRGLDTQLSLMQAESELIATKLGADPAKIDNEQQKHGLEQFRTGLRLTLGGSLSVLALPGLSDAWRRDRLVALDAIAPKAAPLLEAADATALHKMALDLAQSQTDPDVQAGLQRFAAAFPG
jgi:hypothetical protein